MVLSINEISQSCRACIERAEKDRLIIDSNVVELCAGNINAPLGDIRTALNVAGYGNRFPNATSNVPHYDEEGI